MPRSKGNTNARKHGVYSVNRHGREALSDILSDREIELLGSLRTNEGTVRDLQRQAERLGAPTVVFAFGLDDERVHAPNEFFRLSSFELGQRAYCKLLEKLARQEGCNG